jgi:hypothetical protein
MQPSRRRQGPEREPTAILCHVPEFNQIRLGIESYDMFTHDETHSS